MAPRTLATLATVLSAARDADSALTLLQNEAADIERSSQLALFMCDSRRQLITERLSPSYTGVGRTPLSVAIDHLPAPIRRALNFGAAVVDFGSESDDYMKLLGITPQQQGGILSVRGLTLDGELAGFIAIYEPRKRFGPRIVERLVPALDLFALAFERMAEHDARFEAVRTLEELTRNIHSEYNRALKGLKSQLDEARLMTAAPGAREAARIAELESIVSAATQNAKLRAERLAAVEEQVSHAVGKLQQVHIDLHRQTELNRAQASVLHEIERAVEEKGEDEPAEALRQIKAVLAPRYS